MMKLQTLIQEVSGSNLRRVTNHSQISVIILRLSRNFKTSQDHILFIVHSFIHLFDSILAAPLNKTKNKEFNNQAITI